MAYEEYDYYNEPSTGSLKESLYEILHGLKDPKKLREAGISLKEALQLTPNVTESLGRGGVAQAIGTSGDLRELQDLTHSPFSKGFRNFTRAAQFLANPYATAIQQTAPTTEQTLDFVPRVSAPYEGYKQHETLGEYVAPSLGYFGTKGLKAVKDLPIGGTIQDVNKLPLTPKEVEILASQVDELGFHSPLENAILGIKQPKGTGDQFLKQLEKTPGVKTEELDVTGVKQYLLDHPTVTKQELLDYMGTNRLNLEQKVLNEGTGEVNTYNEYELQGGDVFHDDEYIRGLADDFHYDMKNDPVIRDQEKQALLQTDPERYADYETNPYSQARLEEDIDGSMWEQAKQQANDIYYENPIRHYYDEHGYDVYGNDEMGYSVKDPQNNFVTHIGDHYDFSDIQHALREHLLDEGVLNIDNVGAAKYEDYTLPGKYENYREILTIIPENLQGNLLGSKRFNELQQMIKNGSMKFDSPEYKEYDSLVKQATNKKFESNHFDEPNVLAHTRLNDRIINGKKTLMVEEIQSDWHQAGRKKGYDTPEVRQKIKDERQKLLDQKEHFAELAEPYANVGKDAPPEIVEGWTKAANGLQELQQIENNMRSAVPNAPFKKNWHELMMKQILNEAVKGDYDAVAFTTGKVQADRYSLSKQINELSYNPETKQLWAYKDGYSSPVVSKIVPKEDLPDVIGKEAAKKLLDTKLTTYLSDKGETLHHQLTGQDLDVGGEGMKGFYDKILPDYINKYGKKYGIKVKQTTLNTSNHNLDNKIIYEDGKYLVDAGDGLNYNTFDTKADAIRSLGGNDPEIHYFDVTDMAKKDIKEKGQPLFSGIGLAAPPLLMDDED